MKRILSLLLACVLLAGCSEKSAPDARGPDSSYTPPPLEYDGYSQIFSPAASPRVEAALSKFGLDLLREMRAEADGPVLLSPFSAALVLSMAANGAEGETLAQLQQVLGGGAELEELNGAWAQLLLDLRALEGSTQYSLATSLWKGVDGRLDGAFIGTCRGGYGAQLYEANLSDPRIVDDLNAWVSDHTGGLIPALITQPFDRDTALLLVNALCLNTRWQEETAPSGTGEMQFFPQKGVPRKTACLCWRGAVLSSLQGEAGQGVVLPYDDGRLAFFALLPDLYPRFSSLEEWLACLEWDTAAALLREREDTLFLRLVLPQVEAEGQSDLAELLPALGLEDLFDPARADFSAMGGDYFLSRLIHAAKLSVSETGTQAAASSGAAMDPTGPEPAQEGITLELNRAFLYGIVDLQTGVPLFLGTYE